MSIGGPCLNFVAPEALQIGHQKGSGERCLGIPFPLIQPFSIMSCREETYLCPYAQCAWTKSATKMISKKDGQNILVGELNIKEIIVIDVPIFST